MKYLKTILVLVLAIPQILSPVWASLFKGEDSFFEAWSPEQTYTSDYCIELKKDPKEDFVILNFTDVQIEKWDAQGELGRAATQTIYKLIKETNPDLITVTGDNGWCTSAYLKLIKDIDRFGIPWAPVMGNHDGSCCISEFWCAYKLYEAKNCIFKFGPKGMGYGNYAINITENGKVIHTVVMMDSHDGDEFINADQQAWYRWVLEGVAKKEGRTVESSVFFHIPVPEFATAYAQAYDKQKNCFVGDYAATSFGVNHEEVCYSNATSPFFGLCKELGTKNIICGHDHVNCSSILYQGIRLTYGLHTGPGGYWEEEMSG
ncbi:MAG TPA: hypothetical protein DDY98_00710, partial [Ruminococcaceae bacterium]|nr:hypothetical protein [Oscillospiraceae bacterium]